MAIKDSIKGVIRFAKAVRSNMDSDTIAEAANAQDSVGIDIAYFLHMVGKGMRSIITPSDMEAVEREIRAWNEKFRAQCSVQLQPHLYHDVDQMARIHSFAGELLQVAEADPDSIHEQIGIKEPIKSTLQSVQGLAGQSMQETNEETIRQVASRGLQSLLRHRSAAGGYAEIVRPGFASLPYEALIRLDVPTDVRAQFEEKADRRDDYHQILLGYGEITSNLHSTEVRKAAVHFANCHSMAKLHNDQITDTKQWEDVTA